MRNAGHELEEVNYAKTPLTVEQVEELVGLAGGVAPVLNTRNATVKEKGWVEKPPSAKDFAKAVVGDPNLLKRPLLVHGGKLIIGFDRAAYAKIKS